MRGRVHCSEGRGRCRAPGFSPSLGTHLAHSKDNFGLLSLPIPLHAGRGTLPQAVGLIGPEEGGYQDRGSEPQVEEVPWVK